VCNTEFDSVHVCAVTSIEAIPIPLPFVGSVNAWLVRGEPLTLIDTGPRSDDALEALERGLRLRGIRIEDIELVIGTHHHHDHVGLAATIKRRSGARIAVLAPTAEYGERYQDNVARDRVFSRELMRGHGVPQALFGPTEDLWDYIGATAEAFDAEIRLHDGDRIRAGGRELRVIARAGHSQTDTLFVDPTARLAFVGDHLLAKISPNTEISPTAGPGRSRPRVDYMDGLRRTARMPLDRCLPGHGPAVYSAGGVVRAELARHRWRCRRIIRILERRPSTAFAIGTHLWREAIVREQPLLVVWEVLGHLDLMLAAGIVGERDGDDGRWRYSLTRIGSNNRGGKRVVHAS
jgi:glyoxylase-like metal-dependent hydrolase (beta-lactamase superfamily II)